MHFQVLVIFLCLLLLIQNVSGIYAENIEYDLQNSSISVEKIRSNSNSKIHSLLIQWQLSENPNEFARKNNLSTNDNKIRVYIYLQNNESLSQFPKEIDIITSYDNVVDAFVSSNQLFELDQLDNVIKITPPILARTPPIPQLQVENNTDSEDNKNDLYWIVIITIGAGGIYLLYKKRKK
jgi:hypothetical protein